MIRLTRRGHAGWLDTVAGLGSMGGALPRRLDLCPPPKPYESPALDALERAYSSPAFRYLSGRPLEEVPPEVLGLADLVTDVYGPLQYAGQIPCGAL